MVRGRTNEIRRFILELAQAQSGGIAARVAREYGITRQAVNRHLHALEDEGHIVGHGSTRARVWRLAPPETVVKRLRMTPVVTEERLWNEYGRPAVMAAPPSIRRISHFGFTSAVGNVIDHADARRITVSVARDPVSVEMAVTDDGLGLFRKLADGFGFESEAVAVFELSKGKLTTDPERRAGISLFLASRMFDRFEIQSGKTTLSYTTSDDAWSARPEPYSIGGTSVRMRIGFSSQSDLDDVIECHTAGAGRVLSRMHVHAALLQRDDELLVSRAQARRLVARLSQCDEALVDFRGVDTIGPAFADEVFRVFRARHPNTTLVTLHAGAAVRARIHDVIAGS